MSNRAERRRMLKSKPRAQRAYESMTQAEKNLFLMKNGITDEVLLDEKKKSYDLGCYATIRHCYAAALLAANEEFGFGHDRLMKLLRKIDSIVTYDMTNQEAIEAVYDRFKISINFKSDGMFEERIFENV